MFTFTISKVSHLSQIRYVSLRHLHGCFRFTKVDRVTWGPATLLSQVWVCSESLNSVKYKKQTILRCPYFLLGALLIMGETTPNKGVCFWMVFTRYPIRLEYLLLIDRSFNPISCKQFLKIFYQSRTADLRIPQGHMGLWNELESHENHTR